MSAPLPSEEGILEYRRQMLVRLQTYAFRAFLSIVILRSTMLIVGGPNPTGFIDLAIQANAAMFCRISMLLMARGRFQQAVSVFLGAVLATVGMTAIILEQPILLNTALMLTMFTVLALVIEIPRRALGWGLISILVWLIAQGVRGLLGHGADLEPQFNAVNAVAPVIFLGVITWMLQQNTRHLYATIRVSEQARAEVEEGHRRVALANRKLEDYNTALHSANTQLIEAREAAELANQSKSQFLANMSHELRTPLNAILGYSEMLFEETTDPQAREDLRRIHASGEHLLTLINDILDISKIESGKMELYLEDFEIRSLISETIATAEPLIERNENRLALDVPPSIGLMHADVTKVRQSLLNLLSNAAKFTSKGTITLTALREREPGGDWIVISVRDTGIGMTPEQQQRIFEPFSQVDASTTRKFGGTGLGLAITRSFCEMMGGTISGVSEQGVGSTFTIRLPAVVSEGSEEVDEDAVGEAPDDAFKVLVIDADNTARHLLRQYFEREGWHVVGAPSCERARARAREVNPHVILLDVELPDCDGWEFLREIKRDDVFGHAPVIVATAIDDKKRAFNLGASEFVTKPIERGQLIRMLRTYKRMLTDDRSSRP